MTAQGGISGLEYKHICNRSAIRWRGPFQALRATSSRPLVATRWARTVV
ncbi:hypothetical protein KOXY103107_00160 [Komagataeibacter xylinus]